MFADIIKFYFIFFCCLYICIKIMNYKFVSFSNKFLFGTLLLILAISSAFLKIHIEELTYIVPLLLLWILLSFYTLQPQSTFVACMISFGLSYVLFAIAGFVSVIFISPIHYTSSTSPFIALAILTAILQTSLVIGLFQLKRFQKGMPFLFSTTSINIATIVCLLLLTFLMLIWPKNSILWIQVLSLFLFILTLAILIFWWQAQLTKSYKRQLQLRELESLRTELQEKDKLLATLSKQNEELGRLVHKDNKLIPAMEHAVREYLITDFENRESAIDKGNTLLLELEQLSKSRSHIILEINQNHQKHYSTSIPALDTLLNYMSQRARQEHITLSVHNALNLEEYVPKIISADDIVHVLSDLLENALIATKGCSNPIVQLQFYQADKYFVFEIADNGVPFKIDSLVNFGLTQFTTHSDTGGSGIGLMDIWKIKEKYSASLHITEYNENAIYTKKISFIFDKKNRYSISSNRKEEILHVSKRADLHIF